MLIMRRLIKYPFVFYSAIAAVLILTLSSNTIIRPEGKKIKVVCIDAGHGGKDPGCHGDFVNEKDVALSIALKLGRYIQTNFPEIKVVYTRSTDVFIELNERANIANRNHADIFICIHCNSACVRKKNAKGKFYDVCNETAQGSSTYVMGLHKTEGNLDVSKRENDAVLLEDNYQQNYNLNINSDEAAIIFSTYQNLYLEESMRFADLCQQQFTGYAGRDDDGVKQAGFLVLWKTSMPSVLIETGFLTNPKEEKFLSLEKGQTHMAASIFRAFRKWKDELEGISKVYLDEVEKMKPYLPELTDTAGLKKAVNHASSKTPIAPVNDVIDVLVPQKDSLIVEVAIDSVKKAIVIDLKPVVDPQLKEMVLVYRVQIVASDKQLKVTAPEFKGLSDIWSYETKGIYKYTDGAYGTQAEALTRQIELRKKGFTEAFVVVFDADGKRLTMEEARKFNLPK